MASRKQQPPIDHDAVADEVRAKLNAKAAAGAKVPQRTNKTGKVVVSDYCDHVKRDGQPCKNPAGKNTDHVGAGQCWLHGGMTPPGKRSAGRDQLLRLAGRNLQDVRPMDAILMCVRLTAMEVKVFSEKIEELESIDDLIERPDEEVVAGMHADKFWVKKQKQLSIWMRMREKAMDRLVRYSKQALDAGIEERQVRIAERMGDIMAETMRLVLDDLDLTDEQLAKAPQVIRARMSGYELGQGAA